jgi:hypothetical protein
MQRISFDVFVDVCRSYVNLIYWNFINSCIEYCLINLFTTIVYHWEINLGKLLLWVLDLCINQIYSISAGTVKKFY